MPISKLRPSFTLTEDRLRELQAVVPEAFTDGRINWDTLREAFGEMLEGEDKGALPIWKYCRMQMTCVRTSLHDKIGTNLFRIR
jgi:hypothetical protein